MNTDVNILCLVKGRERFSFMYTDDQLACLAARLGVFAARPDLNFTWKDASRLMLRARLTAAQYKDPKT